MWTTVLVITLYSSVWCIHGHIQWFMQHNLLFPKIASPSQCASLWRNMLHARVRWLCWQIFGHFRPEIGYGALPRRSRNLYKMLPIYSSSIWHKAFDPPRLAAIYNLTKSPTAKSLTGTLQRIRSASETQLCKVWLKTWQVHLFMQEHEKRKPWRVIIPSKYQLKMIYTKCWLSLSHWDETFCYQIISV